MCQSSICQIQLKYKYCHFMISTNVLAKTCINLPLKLNIISAYSLLAQIIYLLKQFIWYTCVSSSTIVFLLCFFKQSAIDLIRWNLNNNMLIFYFKNPIIIASCAMLANKIYKIYTITQYLIAIFSSFTIKKKWIKLYLFLLQHKQETKKIFIKSISSLSHCVWRCFCLFLRFLMITITQ